MSMGYEDDLPSDADMLNWLERHPEVKIEHHDGWWRIHQDVPNGKGFWSSHDGVRGAFELAMRKLP